MCANITSSPLHLACEAGIGFAVREMLLSSAVNPKLVNPKTGQTPIDLAITAMLTEEVKSNKNKRFICVVSKYYVGSSFIIAFYGKSAKRTVFRRETF